MAELCDALMFFKNGRDAFAFFGRGGGTCCITKSPGASGLAYAAAELLSGCSGPLK